MQNINSKTAEKMEEQEAEDGINDSVLQSDSAESQSETEAQGKLAEACAKCSWRVEGIFM